MFEGLAERGYSEKQYEIIFDLGLAEYHSEMRNHGFLGELEDWDEFGWSELTHWEGKFLHKFKIPYTTDNTMFFINNIYLL